MIISFKHNDTDYINFDTDDTDAMAMLQGHLGDTVLQQIITAAATPAPSMPQTPTLEQRTAALEAAMLAMMGGAANV